MPTEAMLAAVHDAELGDDKRDGDPTVGKLEGMVSDGLGLEDAVYLPSGTMGNQIAAKVHTSAGQEVLIDRWSHAYTSEFAGLAQLSRLQVRTFDATSDGCPSARTIEAAYGERSQWPGSGLLILENTHNRRGGVVIEPAVLNEAGRKAQALGLNVHLDGARLANASIALDEELSAFTGSVDSVMFDFSKGLSAPIGSVLAGSSAFIDEARQQRNLFGGGWRQAGVVASMCIEAYEHMDRLADDHRNAKAFADGIEARTELDVVPPESNIVLVDTRAIDMTATQFVTACEQNGVRGGRIREGVVRFCFYRDISQADAEEAVDIIDSMLD